MLGHWTIRVGIAQILTIPIGFGIIWSIIWGVLLLKNCELPVPIEVEEKDGEKGEEKNASPE